MSRAHIIVGAGFTKTRRLFFFFFRTRPRRIPRTPINQTRFPYVFFFFSSTDRRRKKNNKPAGYRIVYGNRMYRRQNMFDVRMRFYSSSQSTVYVTLGVISDIVQHYLTNSLPSFRRLRNVIVFLPRFNRAALSIIRIFFLAKTRNAYT